jgi:acetyl esterase
MALDEATRAFIEAEVAACGGRALAERSVAEAREAFAGRRSRYGAAPDIARIDEVSIATDDGAFPCRIVFPKTEPIGVLVWYHGGGWVVGAMDDFDVLVRHLAVDTRCVVVQVDYRLAPEHAFPRPVDDAYAALVWTAANVAGALPIFVGGDSAGANLAAVVARRARDRNGPPIAVQILVYPVADADFERPSYVDPANQLLLSREAMRWYWDHYLPDARRRNDPDASPLRAAHLAGLPPAIVVTAEHDVLRDEGEAYAAELERAGVSVVGKRFAGQMHGFFTLVNILPAAALARAFVVTAMDGLRVRPKM